MKIVIVLPTYNEKENIVRLIEVVSRELASIEQSSAFRISLLVVDDNSPDGTGKIVKAIAKENNRVHLLTGQKKGLGRAYMRGFRYAIDFLQANAVMEMDSDFSHDPKDIKRLIYPLMQDFDFVIGSRYVKGGSIPEEWSLIRKMNSRYGNIFARYVAGIPSVHDCTAGFRAIKVSLLEKTAFDQLKTDGYCFQMNLLYSAIKHGANVLEVPVHFIDRRYGKSKIRLKDIREFILNAFKLRLTGVLRSKNNFQSGIQTKSANSV